MKDSHLADDCFPFCTHSQTRGCKASGQRSERHSRRIQKLSPIMNGIFLRIPKHLQRRGIKWFSLGAVKSPLLVLQTAVQRLGIRPASELIIKTGLLGSNLIVLPTSLLRLLAHFNNCFTCERLLLQVEFIQNWKFSHHLLIPMMMESRIKFKSSRIFLNNYSRWGFDL